MEAIPKENMSETPPPPRTSSSSRDDPLLDSSSASDVEKATLPHQETLNPAHQEQAREIRGFKWFIMCLGLDITAFLYGLDTTIAADVQGVVVEQFNSIEQLAWIGTGFVLGSVSIILPLGELYNSFNMKWLFISSVILFEVGSTVCGAAPNMDALIVGRIIAGMGGSGIYLGGLNIISALTHPKERGTYISLIGFCWGLGSVLGPVIGGSFSDSSATWRWSFYINLVIGAVLAPGFIWLLPDINFGKGSSISSRIAKLDVVGFVLGAGLWVTFTMALTMAGGQWPWGDGRTIAMFVVFGVILVLYVLQQGFAVFTTKEARAFPVQLLKSRTHVLLFVASAANVTVLFVVVYFIPIYFQFVHGDSALMAAVRLLPFVIITVFFNVVSGYALPKVQYYMVTYVVSGILMTLGAALLMAYLDPATAPANIYGFSVLAAVGTGLTLQSQYTISGIKAGKDIGKAISLQNVSQIGGSTIALVIAGQIFQSFAFKNLSSVLSDMGFSAAQIRSAIAGAQSELFSQLTGSLKEAAIQAITQAMQTTFIMIIVGGAVTIVAGSLMRFEKLFV